MIPTVTLSLTEYDHLRTTIDNQREELAELRTKQAKIDEAVNGETAEASAPQEEIYIAGLGQYAESLRLNPLWASRF